VNLMQLRDQQPMTSSTSISDKCPVCGAQGKAKVILPRFNGEAYGHCLCKACKATYDSNANEIRQLEIDEEMVRGVQNREDYQKLFVETWEIADSSGEVYAAFQWEDNESLREGVAKHVLDAIDRYGNAGNAKGDATKSSVKVLDVGCGNGFTTKILARRFGIENVIGLDPSPMVEEMSRSTKIPGIRGTLESVRFEDNQFDIVVILGNLMLHADVNRTLTETARILKPSGLIVFDFKNIQSLSRILSIKLASLSKRLARNGFLQRNFVNMRYGFSRAHLKMIVPNELEILEVFDKPPRLLEFANKSHFQTGIKGFVWRMLNQIDRMRGQQAWVQVAARKKA
jgi:SAM-dependent methyltransferase